MNEIEKMKEELEKFKILKQAKEELDSEFFEKYCKYVGINLNFSDKEDIKQALKSNINNEKIWTIPSSDLSISTKDKKKNLNNFLSDFDSNILKLFNDLPGGWHINTQRNNRLEYQIEIEPGDEIDKLAVNAVENIGKRKIKVDSKDGEYVFAYIFNPIFAHLGFQKRFEVDDKLYEGMGDNGDFKYGMKRLDIKLRQRKLASHRWDLWVNEKDADAGYSEFILMRRDGDDGKTGKQRRITVAGYAPVELVKSVPPENRNRREKVLKYEVEESKMHDMRDLIRIVLEEVLATEES